MEKKPEEGTTYRPSLPPGPLDGHSDALSAGSNPSTPPVRSVSKSQSNPGHPNPNAEIGDWWPGADPKQYP